MNTPYIALRMLCGAVGVYITVEGIFHGIHEQSHTLFKIQERKSDYLAAQLQTLTIVCKM